MIKLNIAIVRKKTYTKFSEKGGEKMNNKILIGIIAITVIVGAVILLGGGKKTQEQTPANNYNAGEESALTEESQPAQAPETVTIDVTSSGFSPASVSIKPGGRVVWNNKSGGDISINSDDHPTHRLFKELNIGHVPDNSTASVLLEKQGTYTYHDHYNPGRTGTIVVK